MGMKDASGLHGVAEGIERLLMWVRRQAPSQVSSSTITTLDTLAGSGPLRVSELAEREAISQPGMTTLVNRLEAAGQAERVADPSDGRATLVRITEAGRAVLAHRHAERASALLRYLNLLDADERAALVAAVPAVVHLVSLDAEALTTTDRESAENTAR